MRLLLLSLRHSARVAAKTKPALFSKSRNLHTRDTPYRCSAGRELRLQHVVVPDDRHIAVRAQSGAAGTRDNADPEQNERPDHDVELGHTRLDGCPSQARDQNEETDKDGEKSHGDGLLQFASHRASGCNQPESSFEESPSHFAQACEAGN